MRWKKHIEDESKFLDLVFVLNLDKDLTFER